MAYQSEKDLEDKVVNQLSTMKYEVVDIKNYDDLLSNFRTQVNHFNRKRLDGTPLSDSEFRRLRVQVESKGVFDSAVLLRDKLTVERDDGTHVFIQLFNTKDWCHNIFQVTHQVTSQGETRENRYDVTILMNGLPLIQMELKRPGIDLKTAFNQVERYQRKNKSFHGLFNFIQLFIISNGASTKYFANSDHKPSYSHVFHWTDQENERISSLEKFVDVFLERCHAAKMIARHMVVQHTDRRLMVMRPYQIYGAEALVHRALETNNNGYIWHATGSGKTLTSFKVSQILADSRKFEKVIFLVDRRDLDGQTIEEFNRFSDGSVDRTKNTDSLVKQMGQTSTRLVLTTIQKLSVAVKNARFAKIMDEYKDKPVAFIIDECHRSQFGSMHKDIRQHFSKAQFFGFTGTPIFENNVSSSGRATADLFEKCLHSYLIKDSIRDGNTLPFSVSYYSTFQEKEVEDGDKEIQAIATSEIWDADDRIHIVADDILQDRDRKLPKDASGIHLKNYNAMLATSSIAALVKYYDTVQKLNALRPVENQYKIAAIFTPGENDDLEDESTELSRDSLSRIIADYNTAFGVNFSVDDTVAYFSDVSKRVKNGSIDLLVVVNMFLTGFDSPNLHALYVDKNLEHHGLIQAFSRTNRVSDTKKKVGFVRCYRDLSEQTDAAIRLFSETDKVDEVLAKPYEEAKKDLIAAWMELQTIAVDAEEALRIESEEEQLRYVQAFKQMSKHLRYLEPFTEFVWDDLPFTERQYQNHLSAHLEFHDRARRDVEKESILADVDFALEEIRSDVINVDYILDLLFRSDLSDRTQKERITSELTRSTDPVLHKKKDLIARFLEEFNPLGEKISNFAAFNEFLEAERTKEIEKFTLSNGFIHLSDLRRILTSYEYSGKIDKTLLRQSLEGKGKFMEKRRWEKQIESFIRALEDRYSRRED